jgi:WD40 repeat protein
VVQEFIDGQNLEQDLAQFGAWPSAKVTKLLASMPPVLDSIHGHQVIHRDIKPENIIARTSDETLRVWNVATGKNLRVLAGLPETNALLFGPNDRFWASAHSDCSIKFWQTANHQCIGQLRGHSDLVNAIALSPDGQTLVSASADTTLKIWVLKIVQSVG